VVERLSGKVDDLAKYSDEVENFDAYQHVVDDIESYMGALKEVLGDALL
jgi:hypothetical protein